MSRTHGKPATYMKGGCRCDECRAAHAAFQKAARLRRQQRLAENPDLAVHGDANTYSNWRCRCKPCTAAWAAKSNVFLTALKYYEADS